MASVASLVRVAAICMLVLFFGSELLEARTGSVLLQKPEVLELAEQVLLSVTERTCTTDSCKLCMGSCKRISWMLKDGHDIKDGHDSCVEMCYKSTPKARVCTKDGCQACEAQCNHSFWMDKELKDKCLVSCDDSNF